MSAHPRHGTKPLSAALRVAAQMPRTEGQSDIQLYKVQLTLRVQGFEAACKRAEEIKIHTGTAPIISRV